MSVIFSCLNFQVIYPNEYDSEIILKCLGIVILPNPKVRCECDLAAWVLRAEFSCNRTYVNVIIAPRSTGLFSFFFFLFEESKPVWGVLDIPLWADYFVWVSWCRFWLHHKDKRIIVTLIVVHTSVGRDKTCSCQTVHSQRGWGRGAGRFWRDAGAGRGTSPTSFQVLVSLNICC